MQTAADLAAARSAPEWDKQRCLNCKWSNLDEEGVVDSCHINPPTIDGFPEVCAEDWCGKWEWVTI